jgi:predicted dehydrogenase
MAVYHISQTLYLLGNPEVQTVSAATYDEVGMYPERRTASGYDVEELGVGLVRLAGGISFFIEEAWAIHADRAEGVSVFGNVGGIRIAPNPNNVPPGDGLYFFNTTSDMEMNATFDLGSANTRWHRCDPNYRGYDSPQAHWLCALLGIVPLMDTAGIALNTSLITEGLYRSSQLGREVTLEDITRSNLDA